MCLSTGAKATADTFKSQSEDCLFLDVYAPSNATTTSKLPVFFFIQGGGFNSNSNANYNGSGLIQASQDGMLVVNFNYRVGMYGFLNSNANGSDTTPNNGLWDQVKALEWVRDNIAKFGGDPKHVVIGGDSAGAASVAYHLTRGGGKDYGLFVGAAAESVSYATSLYVDEAQFLYDNFAIRANCVTPEQDSLACLRNLTTEQLQTVNTNPVPLPGAQNPPLYSWNPVVDNDFIKDLRYDAFKKGNFVKVPVLVGDDTNGGTVFTPRDTTTIPDMNTFLHNQFPRLTPDDLATIDKFNPNPHEDQCPAKGCRWRQVSDAYGRMRYMCPGLSINEGYAKHGVNKTWAYRWNVEDPDQIKDGVGVPHTVEVNAVFGPTNTNGGAPKSYYEGQVNANAVTVAQGYWASFITTLDPNTHRAKGAVKWEPWGCKKQRIVVNTGGETEMEKISDNLRDNCKFLGDISTRVRQ